MNHSSICAARRTLMALCVCLMLLLGVSAQNEVPGDEEYLFTGTELWGNSAEAPEGVYICGVPESDASCLYLGSRVIRSGDFLPASALDQLVLRPSLDEDSVATIRYMTICEGQLSQECQFTVNIKSTRDDPPVAESSSFETYKNIAGTGVLKVADPEGLTMTYTVQQQPKRGTVVLNEDGTFVYTPRKNKVGEDSFTFIATDAAGNTSGEATVSISILEPLNESTFADMDETGQFTAMWMREAGLYGGEQIVDKLCFCPEKAVTRGEFLVMAMRLAEIDPEIGLLTSGFSDQETAPSWMQPYLVSAMRRGIVTGVSTADGLMFLPNRTITAAEASVIISNIFKLPQVQSVDSIPGRDVPAWIQRSVATLSDAGIALNMEATEPMNRLQAAQLLYQAARLGK